MNEQEIFMLISEMAKEENLTADSHKLTGSRGIHILNGGYIAILLSVSAVDKAFFA